MTNYFTYTKRLILTGIFLFIFVSCIKDEYDEIILNEDGSIAFICGSNNPVTKTTLNGLITHWVENTDKVGIFSPQARTTAGGAAGVVNIPLTAQSSGERSQFSGTVFWGAGEHNFYSYYPYKVGTPAYTAVPVSLPKDQTQSAGNNLDHLGDLDFLVAKPYTAKHPGTLGNGASVSLRYNHLFTILEFQIIRSTGSGAISKVKLTGNIPLGFESGTIDLSQSTPASGVSYVIDGMSNTSNSVIVSLGTSITPTSDYSTTPRVYMVVLPGAHTGDVKISFESAGVFKEVKKSNVTFERGKKYIVKVDAAGAEIPVISGSELEPVTVDGVTWAPINAGYREDLPQGEYFQWHRKYGFGQQPTVMFANETLWNDDLDQETANDKYKDVFFKSKGSSYEWMPIYQYEWNLTDKFNPCPTGWRLPTKNEAIALIAYGSTSIILENTGGVDGITGRWIGPNHDNPDLRTSTAVFFPFGGIMSYSSGSWPSSTTVGYYWLAYYGEPSTTYNGQMMSISQTQSTNPSTSLTNKANAIFIRCVKSNGSAVPVLNSIKPFDIKYDRAKVGGLIEYQGDYPITERGVFWGTSIKPATNKVIAPTAGIGEFILDLMGLEESKSYFVRAYAKNSQGTIYYGDQYKFTTTAHIADYNGQEVTIDGVTWAPWNAGYVEGLYSYGLLYQWGRRYGQTYNESPSPTRQNGTTTATIANSYTTRGVFYAPTGGFYDWNSTVQTTGIWNVTSYNPCPSGWRPPTSVQIQSLINSGSTWTDSGPGNLKGRWFGGNHNTDHQGSVFLPASGFRTETFAVTLRDSQAFYWAIDIPTTPAYVNYSTILFFSNSNSYINAAVRANGASVRCVKE